MLKVVFASTSVALALLAMPVGTAFAADGPPVQLDGLPAKFVKHAEDIQKGLGSDSDPETARGVYFASTIWPMTYRKLKVCFFGGTNEARSIIAELALHWEQPNHAIKLDFGKTGKFRTCKQNGKTEIQIRVGFDKPGFWSALGANSVVAATQNEQSLNLNGFENITRAKLAPWQVSTIHHEFGHAMALMHEHQNPKSPCEEEFDWEKVNKALGGPPDNWTKEIIDFNMRKLSGPDIVASEFNKKSIMLYQFPAEFYKKGKQANCYVAKPSADISDGDFGEIAGLYPLEESERVKRFEATKAAFTALWNKSGDEVSRGISFDPIKEYFERPGNLNAPDDE